MKKITISTRLYALILASLITLFLSGCSLSGGWGGTGNIKIENFHKGTQGIVLNFVNDFPPASVNYKENFNIGIIASNKGAETAKSVKVLITGYSPQLFKIESEVEPNDKLKVDGDLIELVGFEGRNLMNSNGAEQLLLYSVTPQIETMLPGDEYEANFVANACYDYKTVFSGDVCINPFFSDPTRKSTPPCKVKAAISGSGGQGAPVSVSKIEQQMITPKGANKIQFKVYVSNAANGKIMASSAYDKLCTRDASKILKDDDINVVTVSAKLGEKDISCFLPGEEKAQSAVDLKLGDSDDNYVLCKYDLQELDDVYTTTLKIVLEYGYVSHAEKSVTVKRNY